MSRIARQLSFIFASALFVGALVATAQAKDKVKDKMDTAKDKVGSAVDKTKEKAAEVKDKVKEKMTGKRGSDNVRTAQQSLQDKGFNPGPIDGKMGPKTRDALKTYQSAHSLKPTGRPDAATVKALGG